MVRKYRSSSQTLSPAKVRSVIVNQEERQATIEVDSDQLSLAIGRGGQNVRLAAKLTGYRIDIKSTENEASPVAENEVLAPEMAETPEEEVAEFIESVSIGEPSMEVTEQEELAEDNAAVEANTNTEKE